MKSPSVPLQGTIPFEFAGLLFQLHLDVENIPGTCILTAYGGHPATQVGYPSPFASIYHALRPFPFGTAQRVSGNNPNSSLVFPRLVRYLPPRIPHLYHMVRVSTDPVVGA